MATSTNLMVVSSTVKIGTLKKPCPLHVLKSVTILNSLTKLCQANLSPVARILLPRKEWKWKWIEKVETGVQLGDHLNLQGNRNFCCY